MSAGNAAEGYLASLVIHDDTDLTDLAIAIGPHADRGFAYDVREELLRNGFIGRHVDGVPRDAWLSALDHAAAQTWRRTA